MMQQLPTISPEARRGTSGVARREPMPFPLFLVYTMWVLLLLEPEWWLASFGAEPLKRIPTLLFPVVIGVILLKAGVRSQYWPMALFLALHVLTLPVLTNRGLAMGPTKVVLYFYVLLVASAATIDSARKALPILWIFFFQFAWWGFHGLPGGRVAWHSTLGNEDGFGPMMVMGMAFASFFALGARSRRARRGAMLVAALCSIGIVASFARGAVLAAALVLVVLWVRSRSKGAMLARVVLAGGMMVIASHVLYPGGAFWAEMKTISEGFEDPTGADRWHLWVAGWKTFLHAPLFGVGPGNFGAYAAERFQFGDASGFYENPAHLYGRSLHSIYVQVLSEQGLVGMTIFLVILFDFVRRNKRLRREEAIVLWDKATEGHSDIRSISLGLEGAMVAYLANGVFYDQLYTSSLYSIVALNFILDSVTTPRETPVKNAQAATDAPRGREPDTHPGHNPGYAQWYRTKWEGE